MVYVTNAENSGLIYVINAGSDSVSGQITVGSGPTQVVFGADGSAYVNNADAGSVSVINPNGIVVDTLTVGSGSTGVGVNPADNRLYITNGGSNILEWVVLS